MSSYWLQQHFSTSRSLDYFMSIMKHLTTEAYASHTNFTERNDFRNYRKNVYEPTTKLSITNRATIAQNPLVLQFFGSTCAQTVYLRIVRYYFVPFSIGSGSKNNFEISFIWNSNGVSMWMVEIVVKKIYGWNSAQCEITEK